VKCGVPLQSGGNYPPATPPAAGPAQDNASPGGFAPFAAAPSAQGPGYPGGYAQPGQQAPIYYPQAGGYPPPPQQPIYMQGGQGPYPPQALTAGPIPPDMHWFLVLFLGFITMGIFTWIWTFKQASFVKKINPASNALTLMVITVVLVVVSWGVLAVGVAAAIGAQHDSNSGITEETYSVPTETDASAGSEAAIGAFGIVFDFMALAYTILYLVAIFGMRRSIVDYYNYVEPIGLQLGGFMTFFFNILYFQYHFSRIAEWKRAGMLGGFASSARQ
jgi:hypothetical protein